MGNLRRGSGNAGLRGAAVWAAKLGILAAGAAAAAAAARAAAPRVAALVGGGGAALPGAWAAARAWLVPPYLFITVHLIILVIWGLSDHKLHRDHSAPAAPPPPTQEGAEEPAAKPRDLARKPTPEPLREDPAPPPEYSQSSCVTTESDEGSTASSSVLGLKRSVKPSPGSFIRVEEEEEDAREGEGDADNQSMDATWRAIMARSSSSSAPAPAPAPAEEDAAPRGSRRREEAAATTVGGDELTLRFEEFIRRNHDQIRLQREEMMMMKNQKMR